MKLVDEFRQPALSQALIDKIRPLAEKLSLQRNRPLQIMEVCGGHTHTLFRYGIQQLFSEHIEFVHGPGCPVCVLPRDVIDQCIAWAEQPDLILATFGDAIRVPGHQRTLQQARASGADVRVVYSPLDALTLAKENPDKQVIFLAIGFDTTMPSTALTVLQAATEQCDNFSVYAVHITIIATLKTVLNDNSVSLDGLIGPGHVSMVIGTQPYDFIATDYQLPFVVSGFEPLDILQSLYMILLQLEQGSCKVENQYSRTVLPDGNAASLRAISRVYQPKVKSFWQGLGSHAELGVTLKPEYAQFDAEKRFPLLPKLQGDTAENPPHCDDVIMGRVSPPECPNFGKGCTPQTPMGALMVSSEGACAAWYQYKRSPETP